MNNDKIKTIKVILLNASAEVEVMNKKDIVSNLDIFIRDGELSEGTIFELWNVDGKVKAVLID